MKLEDKRKHLRDEMSIHLDVFWDCPHAFLQYDGFCWCVSITLIGEYFGDIDDDASRYHCNLNIATDFKSYEDALSHGVKIANKHFISNDTV